MRQPCGIKSRRKHKDENPIREDGNCPRKRGRSTLYQRQNGEAMSISSSPARPSNGRFGATIVIALCVLSIYGGIRHWSWTKCGWILGANTAFAVLTLAAPSALAPLNRAWFALGQLLGSVMSPVVLGVIFFGLLTPIACVSRFLGRDELRLKRRTIPSYWIGRDPPGLHVSPSRSSSQASMYLFIKELWAFIRVRKKVWLAPVILFHCRHSRIASSGTRFRDRPIHLYAILT